tara:strand:+ start:182 stop:475 length:294 start_codon:yes stop_codon:yes gene_type:complete
MSIVFGEVGKKIMARGLSAAFPEQVSGAPGGYPVAPPRLKTARTWAPRAAGKVTEDDFGGIDYKTTSYDTHLLAWEKRLFAGEDSYTGKITLPKVEV